MLIHSVQKAEERNLDKRIIDSFCIENPIYQAQGGLKERHTLGTWLKYPINK